jgi:hypothetical protein
MGIQAAQIFAANLSGNPEWRGMSSDKGRLLNLVQMRIVGGGTSPASCLR